ncbi:ATP synthase F0 subunit B [Roseomonas sp. HJA6]|uniref:ATP synthase subunit b n=1 Tax=Roseomonas alba TaxID=2846776 RepID=A0ABS7AH78_9PROT|nr:ATP synthase F0 subunit B [Neoroseomonas alba]MBW6400685.1 ATP synthase F0 subunit B [Neoroseomonas alba]
MRIDWWTLGLQTVNVLVLIWILSRFLFRPLAAMIEARRAAATKQLDEANAARAAAEAERQKAQQEAADIAATRADALKRAAEDAEAAKRSSLAAAREETDRLRAAAAADIARDRQQAAADASNRASRLALDIAARLLSRLPEEARVAGFLDGIVTGLADLPAPVRATLGADGAPIRLKAPRALTPEEIATCRARLTEALGRPIDIAPVVEPDLIAGLEIDMPHAAVRNSLRADLDRIAAGLMEPAP